MAATGPRTPDAAGSAKKAKRQPRETVGRERVMQAALHMFLRNGYSGTSMKALAQEIGTSAPALYWYFPSKEELYIAVIEEAMASFTNHIQESITDEDPAQRLGQIVRAHVTFQLQQSDIAHAFNLTMTLKGVSHDISKERLASIVKLELEYVEQVRSVLTTGVEQGVFAVDDIKSTAFAIITMCEYVNTWYNPAGAMSIAAVANRYDGLVRRMVMASATG